jgi:hypothetical protein
LKREWLVEGDIEPVGKAADLKLRRQKIEAGRD